MPGNQLTLVVFGVSDISNLCLILESVLQSYNLSPQKLFCLCLEALE